MDVYLDIDLRTGQCRDIVEKDLGARKVGAQSIALIVLNVSTRSDYMIAEFANQYTYGGMYEYARISGGLERTLAPFEAFQTIAGPKFYGFTTDFQNPLALFGLNNPLGITCKAASNSRYCADDVKMIAMIVSVLFQHCLGALAHLYIQTP